jgi:hypothetical protein
MSVKSLFSLSCGLAACLVIASASLCFGVPAPDEGATSPNPAKGAPKLIPDGAADTANSKDADSKPALHAAHVKRVKPLSPEMAERRDRVRQILSALRAQPFNTQQNTCTDVLDLCRAFGCDTELTDNAGSGQKVNGVTCLCWNMPCAGYSILTASDGHLAARVGYGYQARPSDLAAVLALSHVPADYPARLGKTVRTVSDLIEFEKLTCRQGTDMSLKLVALANYVQQPSWKDDLGGEWSLQRVVKEELDRPQSAYTHAATDRLLGLSVALERFKSDKTPLEGDLGRAKRYVDDTTLYAFSAQNTDGSWGRSANRDYAAAVGNTARMLEWLVTTLPANRLEDPQIVRGVDFLYSMFNSEHYRTYIPLMSSREISAAMHAAYVLNTYDRRVFVPADPAPKVEKPEPKAAALPTDSR